MLNTDTPKKSPLRLQKSPTENDSSKCRNSPAPKPRGTIGIRKSENKSIVHAGSDSDNNNSNSDLDESDAYTPRKSIVQTRYAPWRSTVRNRSSTSTNSFKLQSSSKSRIRKLGVDFGEDSSSDIEELSTDILLKSPVPSLPASRKATTRLSSSKSQNFSRLQASGMTLRKPMVESVEDTNTDSDIEVLNMSTQKSPVQTSSTLRKPTVRTSSSTFRKSSELQPSSSNIEEELYSHRLQSHFPNTRSVNQRNKTPALPHTPLSNGENWWSQNMDTFPSVEKTEQKKEIDRLHTKFKDCVRQSRLKNVGNSPQTSSGSQTWTVRTDSSTSRKSSMLQPSSRIRKPTAQSVEETDAVAKSEGTNNDCKDAFTDSDIEVLDSSIPQKSLLQTYLASPKSTAVASSSTSQNRPTPHPNSSDLEELYTHGIQPHSSNTPLVNGSDNPTSQLSTPGSEDEISSGEKWWSQDMDAFHLARTERQKKELDQLQAKFNQFVGRAPFDNQEAKLWDNSLKVVEWCMPSGTTRIKVINIANDFFKHRRVWPSRTTDIDKLKKELCRTENIRHKSYERSRKTIIQSTSPPKEETEQNREWWRFSSAQQRIEMEELEAQNLRKLRMNFIQHVSRIPYSEHEPRLWEEGIQIVKKWAYSSSSTTEQMLIANDYFEFTSEWPTCMSDLKKLKEHLCNKDHHKAVEKKRREDRVARERIKEAVAREEQKQRQRKKRLHTVKSGRVEKK